MQTLADRWRSYCTRHNLGDDAGAFGAALIDQAQGSMRQRAATVAAGWPSMAPAHQQAALAEGIRALAHE